MMRTTPCPRRPASALDRTAYQGMPTITSEDLTMAIAGLPIASPNSSTASFVIEAVITRPVAISILTWEVVAPFVMATTLPGMTLRAETFKGRSGRELSEPYRPVCGPLL